MEAIVLLVIVAVVKLRMNMPPPLLLTPVAVLLLNVLFVMVSVKGLPELPEPRKKIPPPPVFAVLPVNVEVEMLELPEKNIPPPVSPD